MKSELELGLSRLKLILSAETSDAILATTYGFVSSFLFLALPIAVQGLVNSVGFGSVYQPIVVMTFIVFVILLFSGVAKAFQIYAVEFMQRRLMVRTSLNLANRISSFTPDSWESSDSKSISQKFADIVSIQKNSAILILDGTTILMQIVFGAILLGFYHPYLMMFDVVLITLISAFLAIPFAKGSRTSIQESSSKYEVGDLFSLFKNQKIGSETLSVLDSKLQKYLDNRSKHFDILYFQILAFLGLQIFATTLLLGVGGWLVVQGKISIGQLVAAEIVVGMMIVNIGKLYKQLDSLYDLIASSYKVGSLFDVTSLSKETVNLSKQSSLNFVSTPLFLKRFGFYLKIFLMLLVLVLAFVPWQQNSNAEGRVVAFSPNDRIQTIDAPVEGRIKTWHIQEGSTVKKGDLLAEVTDNDPDILERLKLEKDSVLKRIKAIELSIEVYRKQVQRQNKLLKEGLVSERSAQFSEADLARFEAQEAEARAELARVEVRLARQASQKIVAPIGGMVIRRLPGENGVFVKSSTPLLTLVPNTKSRSVELFVSGNDAPLVTVGTKVRLQFEGWPAIQFAGWPSVAVGTFGGIVAVADDAETPGKGFRVLVVQPKDEYWPEPKFLRQGTRVRGWLLFKQVSIGFELWRQFNGFPPALDQPPEVSKVSI